MQQLLSMLADCGAGTQRESPALSQNWLPHRQCQCPLPHQQPPRASKGRFLKGVELQPLLSWQSWLDSAELPQPVISGGPKWLSHGLFLSFPKMPLTSLPQGTLKVPLLPGKPSFFSFHRLLAPSPSLSPIGMHILGFPDVPGSTRPKWTLYALHFQQAYGSPWHGGSELDSDTDRLRGAREGIVALRAGTADIN